MRYEEHKYMSIQEPILEDKPSTVCSGPALRPDTMAVAGGARFVFDWRSEYGEVTRRRGLGQIEVARK
jgi:hypothetical protein